jgi:hypothetical protein
MDDGLSWSRRGALRRVTVDRVAVRAFCAALPDRPPLALPVPGQVGEWLAGVDMRLVLAIADTRGAVSVR